MLHERRDGKTSEELRPAIKAWRDSGVVRLSEPHLVGAELAGVELEHQNLQNSDLTGADLTDARLERVGFDHTVLTGVNFERAILSRVDFRRTDALQNALWYETILDGVKLPLLNVLGRRCAYDQDLEVDQKRAQYTYRVLKESLKAQGHQDAAGVLYEREMDMKRLRAPVVDRAWLSILWLSCGYGERPLRLMALFLAIVVGCAWAFQRLTLIGPDGAFSGDFGQALYFSIVTFASLGYGDIQPVGMARGLAAVEALLGVFMISLFVFVFCRRMVR